MRASFNPAVQRFAALVLLCLVAPAAHAQTASTQSLRQLRDQLIAQEGLRNADAVAVIRESALATIANQMAGLEIRLANGTVLHLGSIAIQLNTAAAPVEIGVKVSPPVPLPAPVSLTLKGTLGNGEVTQSKLRIPFRLTEVKSDSLPSSLLAAIFRQWLSPERWDAVLPPLEIPLNLSESLEIPAARFDVEGTMPMEITTPAYQVKVNLTLAALMMLKGRAVAALNLQTQTGTANDQSSASLDTPDEAAALESEIENLSRHLTAESDLRIRLSRRALNTLLAGVAAARTTDLDFRLKPARIRNEEKDALVRIHNYADVESGDGRADVQSLLIESINDNRLNLRLTAEGDLTARLRGREYGVPYSLSPRGTFSISNETIPLEVAGENNGVILRAVPGSRVPVRVSLGIEVMGRRLSLPQTISVQADRWFDKLALPEILSREVQLPRIIEVSNGNGMKVVSSEVSRYTLSNLKVTAGDDKVECNFEVAVSPQRTR